jgi:subtilisin family serine protease
MIRLLAIVLAAIALLFAAPAAAKENAAPPDRQILVMVRHPPDHYRPNAAYGGGYDDELARSARQHLARKIAARYGLTLVDEWPMPMIGYDCFVMAVPTGRSTTDAAKQVSSDGDVAWSQPVALYAAQGSGASHNDPLFAAEPAARLWRLADLHRLATGRGVRIAVVDSGIQANHPDLSGQLLVNRNFVAGGSSAPEAHGTGVAGIIAAKADNGIGIAGVAPGARLLGLRACWQQQPGAGGTVCDSFSLAKALYFAVQQKADVINLSLAGPEDRLLHEILATALAGGTTVVTAYDLKRPAGGFPASVPGVIAVSDVSLAATRGRAYTAPGKDVPTTEPGGRWFVVSGSSYAAAHVSGLVALMRQLHRSASLTFVSERTGAIDAFASLVRIAHACDRSCAPIRLASIPAGPVHSIR